MHEVNSKLNYITVMDSKPVSILSSKYGNEPKLHPDEKKGSKDIVQDVCEYYVDKLSSKRLPKRQKQSESSSQEHVMKHGSLRKRGISTCRTRTEWYCEKCSIPVCKSHKVGHGNEQ
ncbi:hypothetical protein TSAR_006754 [Trichomalopsis sarcophagae]|uniref:Uncharacterized protein n=1 Tax=Trichomalopsis sarcophagae TaxID=543379 RepID=A0A232EUE7_9HYME|nr:hypothetical protein TSAR_006754 [Trichomalopsis sarcophagae]